MKRPVSVTVVACVYLLVGAGGFVSHFDLSLIKDISRFDGLWIELVEVLAFIAGLFLLRAQNWARWLALAWMAFHVAAGAFQGFPQFAVHLVFCAIIGWILFRPAATRYFHRVAVT